MKKLLILLFFIGLITLTLFIFNSFAKNKNGEPTTNLSLPTEKTESVKFEEFTAKFEIYTNGTKRVFTDSRYHNKSEDVFIESSESNTIQVKKAGITWDDFFKTLPMKLTDDCLTTGTGQLFCNSENKKLTFFINDIETQNALQKVINKDDTLLVIYK